MLRSVPGVAEINTMGGYAREYQVSANPERLHHYNLTIQDVYSALARNNANTGGGQMPVYEERYLIRGVGLIKNLDDIGNIVLKEVNGTPVFVRNVASVRMGTEIRQGAVVKDGVTESVAGIIQMQRGENARRVVGAIKAKVAEINQRHLLPEGLKIVPFYDRTDLVDAALSNVAKVLLEGVLLVIIVLYVYLGDARSSVIVTATLLLTPLLTFRSDAALSNVAKVLLEGVLLVIIVLYVYLGDARSSVIVTATLLLTPLLTFMVMNHYGLSANLMSLGGLAIAIGIMVDGSVVVVENTFARLGQRAEEGVSRLRIILDSATEVGKPVLFGVGIIILVFMPLL